MKRSAPIDNDNSYKSQDPAEDTGTQPSYQSQLWRHGSAISWLPLLNMDTFALWGDKVKAQFVVASPSSALDVRTHFPRRNQQSSRLVNGQYTKQRRQYTFSLSRSSRSSLFAISGWAFLLDFPKRWDEKKQKEHGREGPSTHLPTETSWVVPAENLQLRP